MAFYQLIAEQNIPAPVSEVWKFISSPDNLKNITPEYLGFEMTTNGGNARMYPGMILAYKVSPILGIKLTWMSEITHVSDQEYFVDEQRIGPYKMWHHQHRITPIKGGVLMVDTVTYQPPFGLIGTIANTLIIKNQLNDIFEFRRLAVEKRFGKYIVVQ